MKTETQEQKIESAAVAEARRIAAELQFEEELLAAEQRGREFIKQAESCAQK